MSGPNLPLPPARHYAAIDRALPFLGALLVCLAYTWRIQEVQFHPDESQWIATSFYFEAFVSGDIDAPHWQTNYWTLTQPPLARYVIAVGRIIGGYQSNELNVVWDFFLDEEANVARGAVPSAGLSSAHCVLHGFCGCWRDKFSSLLAWAPQLARNTRWAPITTIRLGTPALTTTSSTVSATLTAVSLHRLTPPKWLHYAMPYTRSAPP